MASILNARSISGCLASGIMLVACGRSEPDRARPDVLLLVIDTLRADRLSCYGYERPTTPNLDRLAAEGVRFERASAQSSWTLPSMSSLLSGKYLTAHRARPDPEHALLAESFDAAGYRTIGVVANTLLRAEDGFDRGFDLYHVCEPGKTSFDDVLAWLDAPLAEAAQKDEAGKREPLFLYVHAFDPHVPYVRHPEFDAELPPREAPPVDSPEWQRQELAARGPAEPAEDPGWQKALAELRRRRGLYDQEVRYSDDRAGKLLRRLEELGLRNERSIVAVVADHGEGLWEQVSRMDDERLSKAAPDTFFFGGHGQDLSEQALRTPFLLQGTGLPRGVRVSVPVENIDLFPTLLHLADLPVSADLHGRDLVPLLENPGSAWRTESFSFVIHSAAIRDEDAGLKLVLPTSGAGLLGQTLPAGVELYDLARDPSEHVNVASSRESDVQRLRERLELWMTEHPTNKSTRDEDPELRQRLEEQGYAGSLVDEDEDASASDSPPPKGPDD